MKPSLIIIGAMKAGTTSLFQYLASHPQISGSKIKETDFFKADADFNKGIEWYYSLFNPRMQYAFEASPNYTKRHIFPGVPQRINSILPDVKLVYILRDPVKRILSHYIHNFVYGVEKRTMHEVIIENSQKNNYILTSKYFFQLEAFLNFFSQDQLLLIESENLRKQPEFEVNKLLNFWGINEKYSSPIFKQKFHDSSQKKQWTPLERKFSKIITFKPLRQTLKKISNHFKKGIDIPEINKNDLEILKEKLVSDVEKLRSFSGLKLENWSL